MIYAFLESWSLQIRWIKGRRQLFCEPVCLIYYFYRTSSFIHIVIFFVIWIQKKPSSESLKNIAPPLPWESDAYLQPTVPDDGLLQYGMW